MKNYILRLSTIIFVLSASLSSSAFANDDSRKPIIMTSDERNLVLEEMRSFLDSLRIITVALSNNDMATVAESAKKMGMSSSGEVPDALRDKLPKDFKMLAMKTHKAFDLIALDAVDVEDQQHTLEQMGKLMGNCVACHAIFRFEVE